MVSIKYLEDTTKANEDWKQAEKMRLRMKDAKAQSEKLVEDL